MISEPIVNEYRDPDFSTTEKNEELLDTMIVKKKSK